MVIGLARPWIGLGHTYGYGQPGPELRTP